jgi:agmatine deiminase
MVKECETARDFGFKQPADWEAHRSCLVAWPAVDAYWEGHVREAQAEFVAFCAAIAVGRERSEQLEVLVCDAHYEAQAKQALRSVEARFHRIQYGDSWIRDTGPIFLTHKESGLAGACFAFNGWGKKYVYPHDDTVAEGLVRALGIKAFRYPWVMEGGAVDSDGERSCLASRDCLLDANRNPDVDEASMTNKLQQALGCDRVIWLAGKLINDHTDGHVDTLARFVAPGVVVCMAPIDEDDPNAAALEAVADQLERSQDAKERKLLVKRVASPGRVLGRNRQLLPASYLNFYISSNSVIVPIYGSKHDQRAVDQIAALFPGRRAVGLRANAILEGGGAFHCITLSLPAGNSMDR